MITLITNNDDTYGNPILKLICEKSIKDGIGVQIMGKSNEETVPIPKEIRYIKKWNYDVFLPKRFMDVLRFIKWYLQLTILLYKTKTKYLFAIDPAGLIIAGRFKFLNPWLEIHYFSFEIFFNKELSTNYWKTIKAKEIFYTKFVSSIIIQDNLRKEILIKENHIKKPNLIKWNIIPVAPIIANKQVERNKFIREKYNIDRKIKILLHTGSVAEWSGANIFIELLEKGLPENYLLFIHSRFKLSDKILVHKKLMDLQKNGYPLILHDEFFSNDKEYFDFLKNFDFGFALYEKDLRSIYTGENIEHIGLASGKFSYYMAACIPTIAIECKTYEKLNDKYKFGKLIKNSSDLLFSLKSNELLNIDSNNCWRLYKECLDPSFELGKYFETIKGYTNTS